MNNRINPQDSTSANREYKDRLFRLVFQKKEDLLSLYNAVNGTSYDDPDDLEVNTLENALYLAMKNDLSFLIGATLNLYEHQSSFNPNMPIRGVMYFSKLYEKHIASHEINIYSSAPKRLPFPQHIVFYNGTQEEPDRLTLRLSDLFERPHTDCTPCLECLTTMLNINYGHNRALMEKCLRLKEYAIFVDTVRKYLSSDISLKISVSLAVDACIKSGILTDILTQQKTEVIQMILETFDQEKYEKAMRREGYEDGYTAGKSDGYKSGASSERDQGIRRLLSTLQELDISRETAAAKICEKYHLSGADAEIYIRKYWQED